jgi:peptidyl-prolyl cis-trans isomerase A (cyclophilin A)
MGDIVIRLDERSAPISTANFLEYVDRGHYNGTIFHRVIADFMIQGGGFTADLNQKRTLASIRNEWRNGLKNVRGAVAMARIGGKPDSASSQFFINVVDNEFLDRPQADGAAYAVFGMVSSGMDVVDRIRAVRTVSRAGMQDVPETPVTITTAERIPE